jgi:hypothetical protein
MHTAGASARGHGRQSTCTRESQQHRIHEHLECSPPLHAHKHAHTHTRTHAHTLTRSHAPTYSRARWQAHTKRPTSNRHRTGRDACSTTGRSHAPPAHRLDAHHPHAAQLSTAASEMGHQGQKPTIKAAPSCAACHSSSASSSAADWSRTRLELRSRAHKSSSAHSTSSALASHKSHEPRASSFCNWPRPHRQ